MYVNMLLTAFLAVMFFPGIVLASYELHIFLKAVSSSEFENQCNKTILDNKQWTNLMNQGTGLAYTELTYLHNLNNIINREWELLRLKMQLECGGVRTDDYNWKLSCHCSQVRPDISKVSC